MISRLRLLVLVLAGATISACGTAESVVTERPSLDPVVVDWERPRPNEIPISPGFREAIESGTRSEDGRPGPAYWMQETSYRIHATLQPDERRLYGTATIRYRNNSPTDLDRLHLELAQNLHAAGAIRVEEAEVTSGVTINRVSIDGLELADGGLGAPGYAVSGTQLIVIPPQRLASGAEAELEINWEFTVPQQGAGARMGHSQDNLFYLGYWYPIMSVYDDVNGWYTRPFRGQAEFYGGFADYDVTIEAPGDWLVMATGDLQNPEAVLAPGVLARMREAHASDEPMQVVGPAQFGEAATTGSADEMLQWRFVAEDVRDFAFSATRESIWDAARTPVGDRDGDGEMDYAAINTFYREAAPLWADVTDFQQHAIAFLSSFSGFPYPWPHMTAVEGADIIGGGMEYPMMTLMGDYNTRGREALYNVTAHELAHMWVPMIASNNERRYTWFDEGMTTFHENEARYDYFPGHEHHVDDQMTYVSFARGGEEFPMMMPSDYHDTSTSFVVASYMKPSTVLVALREVVGEDVFNRAWQTFIRDWAYKHPYPYDFFNTFERESGQDLEWFWRTWYFETWTLDQAIDRVESTANGATIHIRDVGDAPMPVHLTITRADGTTLERKIPVDVWLTGSREASLHVDTDSPIVRVEIDPEMRFPDINRSNNVWTR